MSMSTYVVGYRPADDRWKQMKAIWDACLNANVEPPDEVFDFFGGEYPDGQGVEVDIKCAVKEWTDDGEHGYVVDIQKLPEGVRYIKFYNSW